MRQGNPNKRLRGRNRKGPNPLTKTFESNGPDVKIRGTALHIAEKYLQLSRDAQASGDRVMGENYLQHAEHYFRIVAAAQGANQPQQLSQRDDDQQDASDQPQGQQNGSGSGRDRNSGNGHDPAAADQPSDSGFERQASKVNGQKADRSEAANGNGAGDDQPAAADAPASGETAEATADGEEAPEAKPRRRARAPRTTRSRSRRNSGDAAADAGGQPSDSEAAPSEA
ncbi:DUF4167 domain-containing protein [Amorphus coralli]|uniref:DUF4167 domain-containing protein n=1 Tax=Amorphus coralli TaxID=340680 RepID=UPI000366FB17|nr:DUF4167 domain-containing protein [Amorphus coralli]